MTHSGETDTYFHATTTSHTPTTGGVASRKRRDHPAGKMKGEEAGTTGPGWPATANLKISDGRRQSVTEDN